MTLNRTPAPTGELDRMRCVGMLKLRVPKAEESRPRQIEVKVSE
jgi:hypothetical protein